MSETEIFWQHGLGVENTRDRQSSEFYCWGGGEVLLAELKRGERRVRVVSNGEMYLSIPVIVDGELVEHGGTVIRYTDQLEEAGIKTDRDVDWLMKQMCVNTGYQIWHMNNWFEVYDDEFPEGVVCDTLDMAIDTAKSWLDELSVV